MRRGDVCFVYGQFKGISNHVRNSCVSAQEKKRSGEKWEKKNSLQSNMEVLSSVQQVLLYLHMLSSQSAVHCFYLWKHTHTHTHSVCIRVIYNCYTSL